MFKPAHGGFLLLLLLLLAGAALAAGQPVLVAPDYGSNPLIAPTDGGYGVVWWDYRDQGTPGRYAGGLRFARFADDGSRVGEEVLLELDDPFVGLFDSYLGGHLEPQRDGFLLFAQLDAYAVHTLALDVEGRAAGPSNTLLRKDELYGIRVASGPTAIVMTYPEWYGTFQNWAQRVDDDGYASGIRMPLVFSTLGGPPELYTFDSELARDGNRFVAVWSQYPVGIRLRELTGRGVPDGDPALVHPYGDCAKHISAAAAERRQLVVYSAGCEQRDLFLKTRDRQGTVSQAVLLAGEPYDEGYSRYDETYHPVQAITDGESLLVLYQVHAPELGVPWDRWFLAEYDLEGNPLSPPRDLYAELKMDAYGEVDFVRDEQRDEVLIAWGGGGPQGYGVYFLALRRTD